MSSLLQNLIDRYPEAFDLLFFIGRLGLFVYIAIGLFPILRKHVLNWSNSNTNAPQSANAPTVYNTQQAAQYLHTAQPTANAPQSANAPAADNTQPAALYTHPAQPAANAPQSLNTPRPLNAPTTPPKRSPPRSASPRPNSSWPSSSASTAPASSTSASATATSASHASPPSSSSHSSSYSGEHTAPRPPIHTASPSGNAPARETPLLVHLLRPHRLAPFARPAPDFAPRPSDAGRFSC